MKNLLLLLLLPTICSAQKMHEYKAPNNKIYHVGDTIALGHGSAANGDFIYLTLGGVLAMNSNPNDLSVGAGYSGLNVIIRKIKSFSLNGSSKVYFYVDGGNISNYMLDIDNAIRTCEIRDCK